MSALALMLCALAFLVCEAVTWAMKRQFWIVWFAATPIFLRRALYGALVVAVLLLFKGTVTFIYAKF
jgi:hypothetical protein